MPVLNGYEAAMKIRQADTEVPIVAMTADAISGVEEECQKAGINYYISKPFNPDQFIKTILDLLEQHLEPEDTGKQQLLQREEKNTGKVIKEEEALKLLGNNQQIYHMVLKEYFSENESICDLLEKDLQDKNYSQAAGIVHKVKGSTGNIGAKELYQNAVLLQKALERGQEEEIDELYSEFKRLLMQCLSEISEKLQKA
jgi:CheY-like chemotaxis protein